MQGNGVGSQTYTLNSFRSCFLFMCSAKYFCKTNDSLHTGQCKIANQKSNKIGSNKLAIVENPIQKV